jgi:hypothetical protein
MTEDKAKKVVELIDLPSDCWASINSIVTDGALEEPEQYDSPGALLDHIEEQLNGLIDEAIDVLGNLREKRDEIIKAVTD